MTQLENITCVRRDITDLTILACIEHTVIGIGRTFFDAWCDVSSQLPRDASHRATIVDLAQIGLEYAHEGKPE